MNFTDFGENMMCNYIRGTVPSLPAQFQVALLTAVDETTFTEVSWSGYSRKSVARSLAAWAGTQGKGTTTASNGTSHTTSNNAAIDFGRAGAAATIVALGLFADNDMIAYSMMQNQLEVQQNDQITIAAGTLVCTLGATGGMSDYLSNKIIDWLWRGQTFNYPSTLYMALNTSMPSNSSEGGEISAPEYSRATMNNSNWTAPNEGTISNSVALVYPVPASDWGNVVANSLYDAATSGNMLWWAAVESPRTIVNGAGAPEFPSGAITLQVL